MAASREQIEALIANLEQHGVESAAKFFGTEQFSMLQQAAAQHAQGNLFLLFRQNPDQFGRIVEQARPGYFERMHQGTRPNTGTIGQQNPFDSPRPQTTPQTIGPYTIKRELGRGAMGVVYQAHDSENERDVAIKTLLDHSADIILRFEQERKNLAKLNHPNVVRFYSNGKTEQNIPYFAVELVDGAQTLENLMRNLPAAQDRWMRTATIFEQIAQGLAHAHDKGVVHRDIKPANVLIAQDGTAKVSDFGLAKNLQRVSGLTQEGDILGTLVYMPLEQLEGDQRLVGPHSDVYSFGATLYHALTGKLPHTCTNMYDLGIKLKEETPVSPREIDKTIPPGLEQITLKALQKDPAKRYANGTELAEALTEYVDNERRGRTVRNVVKRGSAAGAIVLGLLGTLAGVQSFRAQRLELDKLGAEKRAQASDLARAQAELKLTQAERATKQERSQTYVNEMRAMIAQDRFNDAGRLYALALDNSTERAALERTLREDKRKIDGIMNVTIDASAGGEWNVDKIFPDRFERIHPPEGTERQTRTIQVPRGTAYVLEANGYRQPLRITRDTTVRIRTPEPLEGFVFVPATMDDAQNDTYFTRWPISRQEYSREQDPTAAARPMTGVTPEDATRFAENYQRQLRRRTRDDRWRVRLPTVDEFVLGLAPQSGRPYPSGATLPQGRAIPISIIQNTPIEELLVPTNIRYTDPRFAVAATGLHLSNCSEIATRNGKYYALMPDFTEQDPRLYGFIAPLNDTSQLDPIVMREIPSNGKSPTLGFRLVAYKQP